MPASPKNVIHFIWLLVFVCSCSTEEVKMPDGTGNSDGLPGTIGVPVITKPEKITFEISPLFAWEAAEGAVAYELVVANLTTGVADVIAETEITETEFMADVDLTEGGYRAIVRAITEDGQYGEWSANHDFEVAVEQGHGDGPVLTNPVANPDTDKPTFTWDEYSGAATYELLVNNMSTGQSKVIYESHLLGTSFTPGISMGQGAYRAWLRAYDESGVASSWSAGLDFAINPN